MALSLKESLAEEKTADAPVSDWSKSRVLRWRLLHGERVHLNEAIDYFVALNMRKLGFTVQRGKDDEGRWAMVTNPKHEPTPAEFEAAKTSSGRKKPQTVEIVPDDGRLPCPDCEGRYKTPDSLRKHRERLHAGVAQRPSGALRRASQGVQGVVPVLGVHLEVFLLHMDEEGGVSVGLRTADGGQYMAQLVGSVG